MTKWLIGTVALSLSAVVWTEVEAQRRAEAQTGQAEQRRADLARKCDIIMVDGHEYVVLRWSGQYYRDGLGPAPFPMYAITHHGGCKACGAKLPAGTVER